MSDVDILLKGLRTAVKDCVKDEQRAAIAYSGGLDSSIISSLASEHLPITRYTCAVEGSVDHKLAMSMNDNAQTASEIILLTESLIRRLVEEAALALDTRNPMVIAYSIPILAVIQNARERVVLAGSLADELFGGYAKYLQDEDPETRMKLDLAKALLEIEAMKEIARKMDKTAGFPFESREVIEIAMTMPIQRKIDQGDRKVVLREVARMLHVEAHDRPKKAAQYSSGVLREMERLAKKDGNDLKSWVETIAPSDRRTS